MRMVAAGGNMGWVTKHRHFAFKVAPLAGQRCRPWDLHNLTQAVRRYQAQLENAHRDIHVQPEAQRCQRNK